jgi:thiosulfate/3-mercaptopyruvate sulfurtransferase
VTLLHTSDVYTALGKPTQTILDARAPARFRGETEPFDPVAGHIPGALNRPFNSNIGPDGLMKPAAQLRTEFDTLLAGHAPASVVHHCGSGISAIPNLLAMQIAGLGSTSLYAGSWSEWCNTPGLPCAQA